MHVAAVGPQIEDRIADDLAGPVIRHVAAAAGLEHFDAARRQLIWRREDVRARRRRFDAERQHVRMLQQQQRVGNAVGASVLDQRALQSQRRRA